MIVKYKNLKCTLVLCAMLLTVGTYGQGFKIRLWPEGSMPNYQPSADREVVSEGQNIKYQLVQTPDLTAYLPAADKATGTAIIICPGGGYSFLSFTHEGIIPARWLAANGIAAFVLKYRLPNSRSNIKSYLSPLLDGRRAIRVVRANSAKWHIHPDRIGIMGFSAGGHLASTVITHIDKGHPDANDTIDRVSARPDFAVLLYPVITMSEPFMHERSRNNLIGLPADTAVAREYSSELQVQAATPPVFIVQAADDEKVPVENSISFFRALEKLKIPAEMHIFPTGGHGFGMGSAKSGTDQWPSLFLSWLHRNLK